MFSYEDFYKLYNCKHEARYQEVKEQLATMMRQMSGTKERGFREKMFWYAKSQGEFLLLLTQMEEKWQPEYDKTASLNELKQDQKLLYQDMQTETYAKSYLNPAYTVGLVGKDLGQVLSVYASLFRSGIQDAYCHRRFMLADLISLYFDLQKRLMHGQVRADQLISMLKRFKAEHFQTEEEIRFHKRYNVSDANWTDRILNEDLNAPYYLYQLGLPVSEQEEKLHRFFAALPQEKIDQLAQTLTRGFQKGFVRDNKDIRKKKMVGLEYPMGMERLIKRVIEIFEQDMNLDCYVLEIMTTAWNRQYQYDHRFDMALYLDEAYVRSGQDAVKKIVQENESLLRGYAGPAVVESFGEDLFVPEQKTECLNLTEEQTEWLRELEQCREQELYRVGKLEESSFTMMALPLPCVGEPFEEIFEEIVKINCAEQDHLEKAQHALINALDRGVAVRILGRQDNETDLIVSLQQLQNPRKQTNFFNCLADVNIPAGEVFTSPQLAGTNGILHVEKAYLNGLLFENLKLTFTDGYVTDYTCSNYEEEAQSRAYVYENLLHPYESLPMGEFAIGTNTMAYCAVKRHDILAKLPVLIVEKLGPHFALGDTCFSYEEDQPVFNPMDRKEVTARDNELSILRKTEPDKAYTQKHTDITLPYDAIGRMSVVKSSGDEIDLLREGRFVLIGTDILNAPMMAMEREFEGGFYVTEHL